MLTVAQTSSAVDRIRRICDIHTDARGLRVALLDVFRATAPFDHFAFLLTDPETEVGSSPVAHVPRQADLPGLIRLKYLTAVNRWTTLDETVATLRAATGDRLERSLLWREMLAADGVADVMSVVFRDAYGCWGFLDLWHVGPGRGFDHSETRLFRSVAPVITSALRRCQARTFHDVATPTARAGPVVLILSAGLAVQAQTPQVDDYLAVLVPPDDERAPVPAAAYNVAAQLVALESGVDLHPARARLHLGRGAWITVAASRIGVRTDGDRRDIAVSLEISSPGERTDVFARAHGLSSRERELVAHLVEGSDTRQIAAAMYLSQNTVQDHLTSVFSKTGVRNRRALLARAVGR